MPQPHISELPRSIQIHMSHVLEFRKTLQCPIRYPTTCIQPGDPLLFHHPENGVPILCRKHWSRLNRVVFAVDCVERR